MLLSANESYERAEQDIEVLTGISISHSTHQRLVHRHTFTEEVVSQPVQTVSIDGGKVRLRNPPGERCIWNDYKTATLDSGLTAACFQQNSVLVNWVNAQPRAEPVFCLGDGHNGIWNLFAQIGSPTQRYEILDWYHLMENLMGVGGSLKRISRVEAMLWQGDVDAALKEFEKCKTKRAVNFGAYIQKHRPRIPNYRYLQAEGFTIGSGEVESAIKQIGRRVKLSGAQWDAKSVPQVLKHRCAYLNGYFSSPLKAKPI